VEVSILLVNGARSQAPLVTDFNLCLIAVLSYTSLELTRRITASGMSRAFATDAAPGLTCRKESVDVDVNHDAERRRAAPDR
jgi:hypothetical protein